MKIITKAIYDIETGLLLHEESYDYSGPVELACGPSGAEKTAQGTEASFSSMLNADYAQNFGAESSILGHLTNILTPIAEAGPDQQGFGSNELAALETSAHQGVGEAYAKGQQALNASVAGRAGGSEVLPNGAEDVLRETLAQQGAKASSDADLNITKANYDQGRNNYNSAVAGLAGVAGEYNPNATASVANSANQTAFSEASQINQENNQWEGELGGLVGGLGGAALSNPALFKK
jgi:hypothetical protein